MSTLFNRFNLLFAALCLGVLGLGVGAPALAQAHNHNSMPGMTMPNTAKTAKAAQAALPLVAQSVSVVAVPPSIKETSAFMVLKNISAQPIKLVKVSAAIAGQAMLMHTIKTANMTGMIPAASLTIPAKGTLTLKNDGDHLMFTGLKRPLKVGESLPIVLTDSAGRSMTVKAAVKKP